MVKRRTAVTTRRATSIPRPEAGTEPAPVEQIREAAQALLAEGRTEEAFEYFLAALAAVLRKNTELELLLAKHGRERVASRSEWISPEQLALLLEELEQLGTAEPVLDMVGEAREDATLEQDIKDANASGRAAEDRPRKRNPGWHTHQVERQIHEVVIAEAERICGGCGREKKSIGADITSRARSSSPAPGTSTSVLGARSTHRPNDRPTNVELHSMSSQLSMDVQDAGCERHLIACPETASL
jgi:hypothetical protein